MAEYILIFVLQIIGVLANALQIAIGLDKEKDDDTFGDVVKSFWNKHRMSVLVSLFVVLPLNIIGHYIIIVYTDLSSTIKYFALYSFGFALVFGYGGQWILYAFLDAMKKRAIEKGEDLIGK